MVMSAGVWTTVGGYKSNCMCGLEVVGSWVREVVGGGGREVVGSWGHEVFIVASC